MTNIFLNVLRAISIGAIVTFSLPASAVNIVNVNIDLSSFPDGTQIPNGTVLDEQFRDIGVLFGARRSTEPVLQDSETIQAVKVSSVGFLPEGESGLFFDPERVFGAVAILNFVEPGTDNSAVVERFSALVDTAFNIRERVELFAFDDTGNLVASNTFSGALGPLAPIELSGDISFSSVEIRTFGDPGIAFTNLSFARVPEPCTVLGTFAVLGFGILLKRKQAL